MVKELVFIATIYVLSLPLIVKLSGPNDAPLVKFYPKLYTITPFCLKPIVFPFHPFEPASVKITLILTVYKLHGAIGQKLENTYSLANFNPGFLV